MKKNLTEDEVDLLNKILSIQKKLWSYTLKKFRRINPTMEDITDWKEKGKFLFGEKNITVYDSSTITGDVEIGKNTWVGPFTALDGTGGLKIGENCSISSKVNIVSHDSIKWALSGGMDSYEYAPISIGDNCFIGTGAFIGKGVSIGNNCLIAANSVVTNDVEDYSIVGGTPARKIGDVIVKENQKIELIFDNDSKTK